MFPYGKGLGKEKYLLAEQGQSHFCRIKNISAGLSYHENMFHIGISLFFFYIFGYWIHITQPLSRDEARASVPSGP